jgi:hypothetical protein
MEEEVKEDIKEGATPKSKREEYAEHFTSIIRC